MPDLFDRLPAKGPKPFLCETCGQLACYGFGHSELKGIQGRWYCAKHRDDHKKRGPEKSVAANQTS